jgi:hypothetical protein
MVALGLLGVIEVGYGISLLLTAMTAAQGVRRTAQRLEEQRKRLSRELLAEIQSQGAARQGT